MTTSLLRGMSTFTFLRLCVRAPRIRIVSMGQSANIAGEISSLHSRHPVNSAARMSAAEIQSSLALASIFALRLFGMFIILPVFALWAEGRPGWSLQLAGVAMGAYGLTQGILQIPYGWLSDRFGRKPLLYAGLGIFVLGSVICAFGEDPWVMIAGRIVQGAGAISGVAIAAVADLTRESQRTKAMAIVGSTIGVVFAVSFGVAPFLERAVGWP